MTISDIFSLLRKRAYFWTKLGLQYFSSTKFLTWRYKEPGVFTITEGTGSLTIANRFDSEFELWISELKSRTKFSSPTGGEPNVEQLTEIGIPRTKFLKFDYKSILQMGVVFYGIQILKRDTNFVITHFRVENSMKGFIKQKEVQGVVLIRSHTNAILKILWPHKHPFAELEKRVTL